MVIRGSKAGWIVLAFTVILGGLVLLALLRSRWAKPANLVDAAFERTRATMADLDMIPLTGRADIVEALSGVPVQVKSVSATDGQLDKLRETVVQLITLYYLEDSSAAYKAYRRECGAFLVPREALEQSAWPLTDSIKYVNESLAASGARIDPDAPVETTYDAFWEARIDLSGVQQPRAVSAGSPGIAMTLQRMNEVGMVDEPFGTGLGLEAWLGGSAMGAREWFRTPAPEPSGQKLVAQCGIVLEFGDEIRRPLILLLWWDPSRERWQLENVMMTNRPAQHLAWPWEL